MFHIPVTDQGELRDEMNHFLANHKVLEIEQTFYQQRNSACWCFCVRYLHEIPDNHTLSANSRQKTDYKQVLNEAEFTIFSRLRECRKTIALNDAVPAYAVFTDEELAGIVKLEEMTPQKMLSINGIGEKKVEKYGKKIVEMYNASNSDKS